MWVWQSSTSTRCRLYGQVLLKHCRVRAWLPIRNAGNHTLSTNPLDSIRASLFSVVSASTEKTGRSPWSPELRQPTNHRKRGRVSTVPGFDAGSVPGFTIAVGPNVAILPASWVKAQRSPGGKEENTGNAPAFSDKLMMGTVEVSAMDPVKLVSPSNGPTLAAV